MIKQRGIFRVPDMGAGDLIARAEARQGLTRIDRSYREWDFWKGVGGRQINWRGLSCEWMTWAPNREINDPDEVRWYYRSLGCVYGLAGVFTAWVGEMDLSHGSYVTVPDESGCLRLPDDSLCVPFLYLDDTHRNLGTNVQCSRWNVACVYVGFSVAS